jgi:hypothetical protein
LLLAAAGGCNNAPALNAGAIPSIARAGEAPIVGAASTSYKSDGQGGWVQEKAPAEGTDEWVLAKARKELAEDRPQAAYRTINAWLSPRERTVGPLIPQAFLIRADATAVNNEYEALYDYETIIKSFPGSPEYVTAVERELEIGVRYLNGLNRKQLGLRWVGAESVGEELLLRVHERMPGSQLGERAVIELGDYYYRELDLASAAVVYQSFAINYPRSAYVMRAKQRQVFANLGQFKGPRYDTISLLDSAVLIRRFQNEYPAQAVAVGLDDALLTRIEDSRAEQLYETATWYMDRGDPVSSRVVLRRLLRNYPQTAAAGKAYAMMKQQGWDVDPQGQQDDYNGGRDKAVGAGMPNAGGKMPESPAASPPQEVTK